MTNEQIVEKYNGEIDDYLCDLCQASKHLDKKIISDIKFNQEYNRIKAEICYINKSALDEATAGRDKRIKELEREREGNNMEKTIQVDFPKTWVLFKVGEYVVLKGKIFRVSYINDNCIMLLPVTVMSTKKGENDGR